MSEFASDSSRLSESSQASPLSQDSQSHQVSQRPFSVIPQSLRDAAALRAAQRRRTDIVEGESVESAVGGHAIEGGFTDGASAGGVCDGVNSAHADMFGAVSTREVGVSDTCDGSAPVDRYGIPRNATLDERLAYVQRMMQREAAAAASVRHPREKSPEHGVLQDFINDLFEAEPEGKIKRLDVVIAADSADLNEDLMEIIELLPPGTYTRQRLCSQLNSAISAHAWSHAYGMVK